MRTIYYHRNDIYINPFFVGLFMGFVISCIIFLYLFYVQKDNKVYRHVIKTNDSENKTISLPNFSENEPVTFFGGQVLQLHYKDNIKNLSSEQFSLDDNKIYIITKKIDKFREHEFINFKKNGKIYNLRIKNKRKHLSNIHYYDFEILQ